jgi:mannosyltransferase
MSRLGSSTGGPPVTVGQIPGISTQLPREAPGAGPVPTAGVDYLPLALITALAGFLRFYRLDHQSLWMDEVLTILSSHTSFDRILFDPPVDPNVPPLYYLLMGALKGFGDGEIALRLPSALAGVLSVPLLYSVATNWLGRSGILATLLLAVSPLHVWYSQEARPYALLIFLALLAVRFLQHALASPRSLWARIAFAITCAAAFYVHTVALAFVAALALYVLLVASGSERRHWLATFAAVALMSMPGVYLLVRIPPTVSANPFYLFSPTHVAYTLWTFATGYSLGPNLIELRTEGMAGIRRNLLLIVPIMGLFSTLLALGLVHLWRSRRDALAALGLWMALPIAFVILGAWVTSHPYNVRYTLLALPPTLMLLASGTRFITLRPVRIGATALLLIYSAGALWNYYTDPRYYRDDNRGAAAFIQAGAEPLDLVIASAAYTTVPLSHYLGSASIELVGYPSGAARGVPGRGPSLGAVFVRPERVEADFRRLLGDRPTFWLFLSRTFHSDPDGNLLRYADLRYRRIAEYVGPGVQAIRYQRPDMGALPVH